ncbi:MAG: serine/threonine protein kinase [Acidobacteria bacterium]|nr:serine/threonine protein kinase [Acidobacteriota bacterium]
MGTIVKFGVFEADLNSRELRKRGLRLHLPDQSFEILAMLVERPGDVITREEIREHLWPHGTVVEFEHSVNSAVKRLRDCLGDSANSPRFIETLPRQGYRFVAPVETPRIALSSPHFRMLGELGRGGMGVVYKAEDLILGRTVALKFLPEELASHLPSLERFRHEARTLATLNHPGICALHGVEEHDGRLCLVMEYLEGQPLSRLIEAGPLEIKKMLQIAVQASEALAAAHSVGILHHDITPANIVLTAEGQVKIFDFGLAEVVRREAARDDAAADQPVTAREDGYGDPFAVEGTTAYVSPEQVQGKGIDARADIFSLGVVLYEMLCGRTPFSVDSSGSRLTAIVQEEPPSPRSLRSAIPEKVEQVVLRCLAKKPEHRYSSAGELHDQLKMCLAPAEERAWRRPAMLAALVVLLSAALVMGGRAMVRASRARWVEHEALPAAARMMEEDRPFAALQLLRTAERLTTPSPELIRVKDRLPGLRVSIRTTPPGADIHIVDYADKEDRTASRWELLGRSPLETDRVPAGDYRIRAVKGGFEPVERLFEISADGNRAIQIMLHAGEEVPPGMVWVPGASPEDQGKVLFPVLPVEMPGFWLDRHEVTNRQFKEFVDAQGYQNKEYWKQPFTKGGRELSWDQAMAEFRDSSGRSGPATWELGSYPEGKAEYPVGGVSWYEAAAYAEFAGKSLPSVHHWFRAAGVGAGRFFEVLEFSNFARKGPAPVESYRGLGPFGTYDMAGNVREWCWNPVSNFRYIMGGGCDDPNYQLTFPNALDPFNRYVSNGFRCARYDAPLAGELTAEMSFVFRDRRSDTPVDDQEYEIYRNLHSYDKADLKARVEFRDDSSPYWHREKVTFQAAYGNERVIAHLFLPSNAVPPYQAVVFFPGSTALVAPTVEAYPTTLVFADRIVRSGRALILPVYKGTLERGPGAYYHWLGQPNRWREMNLQWTRDQGRSIDYMETRNDIDTGKLAYLGFSLGGAVGPLMIAVEPRFKAAILLSGGSFERVPPEVDPWNYASRVKIPVLMQNGRDDFYFTLGASQRPLFRLLGTAEKDKRHLLYEGAHNTYSRLDLAKDMLDWLDRYLGPVKTRPQAP